MDNFKNESEDVVWQLDEAMEFEELMGRRILEQENDWDFRMAQLRDRIDDQLNLQILKEICEESADQFYTQIKRQIYDPICFQICDQI